MNIAKYLLNKNRGRGISVSITFIPICENNLLKECITFIPDECKTIDDLSNKWKSLLKEYEEILIPNIMSSVKYISKYSGLFSFSIKRTRTSRITGELSNAITVNYFFIPEKGIFSTDDNLLNQYREIISYDVKKMLEYIIEGCYIFGLKTTIKTCKITEKVKENKLNI